MQSVGRRVPFILQFQHLAPDDDQAKPFQPGWTWMGESSVPSGSANRREAVLSLDWRFPPPQQAAHCLKLWFIPSFENKKEGGSRDGADDRRKGQVLERDSIAKDPPGRWDQVGDLPSDCGSLPNLSPSDHLAAAVLFSARPLLVSNIFFIFLFCFFFSPLSL